MQAVASWIPAEGRYFVDPSINDVDCGTGWLSEDGDMWTANGGGEPAGDFEDCEILFVGGPRDGERLL